MPKRIALFWPGDARAKPNELALPNVQEATAQIERALKKLGRETYRVEGFLSKPHEAIEKLRPIDDPLVGVCVHWFYGPHTCDGVFGKENPLLLASNFSGRWPGLVGLLNTGACLESIGRGFSRAWTDAPDMSADEEFMARLDEWCTTGRIAYPEDDLEPRIALLAERPERLVELVLRAAQRLQHGDGRQGRERNGRRPAQRSHGNPGNDRVDRRQCGDDTAANAKPEHKAHIR